MPSMCSMAAPASSSACAVTVRPWWQAACSDDELALSTLFTLAPAASSSSTTPVWPL